MSSTKVGIIGGGWPGLMHAKGFKDAGGFSVTAVADLIPDRRQKLQAEAGGAAATYADATELIRDPNVEAVSICLPTYLHMTTALAALKAGKHVILESPPALDARECRKLADAAKKHGKILTCALQRRFGAAELASKQAIEKGYVGQAYQIRSTWMRTRGIPIGTGWYTDREKSGGGALLDLGIHLLDLSWHLLGRPAPASAFAVTRRQFRELAPIDMPFDVEDAGWAIIKFEHGKTLELGVSWAINQPPVRQGTTCQVFGTTGAIEVYTPAGPMLYRQFSSRGDAKDVSLKLPKVSGHAAMFRQFREAIQGKQPLLNSPQQNVVLMQMMEAIYKSAESGKSVDIRATPITDEPVVAVVDE